MLIWVCSKHRDRAVVTKRCLFHMPQQNPKDGGHFLVNLLMRYYYNYCNVLIRMGYSQRHPRYPQPIRMKPSPPTPPINQPKKKSMISTLTKLPHNDTTLPTDPTPKLPTAPV